MQDDLQVNVWNEKHTCRNNFNSQDYQDSDAFWRLFDPKLAGHFPTAGDGGDGEGVSSLVEECVTQVPACHVFSWEMEVSFLWFVWFLRSGCVWKCTFQLMDEPKTWTLESLESLDHSKTALFKAS